MRIIRDTRTNNVNVFPISISCFRCGSIYLAENINDIEVVSFYGTTLYTTKCPCCGNESDKLNLPQDVKDQINNQLAVSKWETSIAEPVVWEPRYIW